MNFRRKPIHSDPATSAFLGRLRTFIKWGVACELVALGVTYIGFDRMNKSSDTRKYVHLNYPAALDGYYYITDTLAGNNLREQDLAAWALSDSDWKENGN